MMKRKEKDKLVIGLLVVFLIYTLMMMNCKWRQVWLASGQGRQGLRMEWSGWIGLSVYWTDTHSLNRHNYGS